MKLTKIYLTLSTWLCLYFSLILPEGVVLKPRKKHFLKYFRCLWSFSSSSWAIQGVGCFVHSLQETVFSAFACPVGFFISMIFRKNYHFWDVFYCRCDTFPQFFVQARTWVILNYTSMVRFGDSLTNSDLFFFKAWKISRISTYSIL